MSYIDSGKCKNCKSTILRSKFKLLLLQKNKQ